MKRLTQYLLFVAALGVCLSVTLRACLPASFGNTGISCDVGVCFSGIPAF
ncbi:MAG: hypothetical protein H9535_10855 [Ignavibacteria bacterium]|nr:hypothetical protein [Ignavibacteria bacterium]